ncbi:hypothetical protein [Streptomyces litchfieldiae]|uniref:Uncharacterized protein n=1 Tax=Streptomyces litchfieldiae TaxID=3075543 RepID=A0ABU2MS05_9ACTN|nr:hypothetical protein [Streptomyces sp. DSM 44938]MDT0344305.1 hypothetical protein [Streptomyces sp. DSM 44938]
MEALTDLVPRPAGEFAVEPRIAFDSVEQAAHAGDRCPISCVCITSTNNCLATGNSYPFA